MAVYLAVARQHGRFIDTFPVEHSNPEVDVAFRGEATIFSLLDVEPQITKGGARLTDPSVRRSSTRWETCTAASRSVWLTSRPAQLLRQVGAFRTSSIHVSYLRPIPLRAEMTFTARVSHAGRSFAVATVDAISSADKLCATATVTAGSRSPTRLRPARAGDRRGVR